MLVGVFFQLSLLASALAFSAAGGQADARLPELPELKTAGFLPAIRTQIEEAEKAARAHPRDAAAVGNLAMILQAYEQYDSAERTYLRAKQLDPASFDWPYLLGAVQMSKGSFEAAAESFQSALRIRPGDFNTELRLGQMLVALAAWDKADSLYQRILTGHSDLPQAWYGLGRVKTAKGDHAGAAASYTRACALFPTYSAAHLALAGELRRLGRQSEAESNAADYSRNPAAEPPLDDPLFQRVRQLNHGVSLRIQHAAQLEKAGKLEEAIREHESALAIDPTNVQVHVNLISLYGRRGDPEKARQHFETATSLSPDRSDAWYNYGVLLFGQSRYPEAEAAFRRALTINPNYAEAHNNLGAIYEQQGRLDVATGEFRAAITARPDYPLARFHLGRIFVNQQKYEEAIQQLLRALQPEDDQTPLYLYALGAAYARAGDRGHALQYYQRAHDAASTHGQAQLLQTIDRDHKMLESER